MSQLQNWHHVIKNVQNANLDQQAIQNRIRGLNKRAYRQQLDRQVEIKNHQISLQNEIKRRELQQARYLAEIQQQARIYSKQVHKQKEKHYGEQNSELAKMQHDIKSHSKEMESKHVRNFLEHPFVKLVDNQDSRMNHLRKKFIKQNEINHLQEEMRNQQRQAHRYKQMQQKNEFIDYVEETHKKRSADREKFKNKYLRIKRPEMDAGLSQNIKPDLSVEKMYVSYLNNQIKSNNQKRVKEKTEMFDDKRIEQFYSSGQVQPDSSPAFLGRNPLTYERRRQLHFINKHLNTQHERSLTSNSQLNSKTEFIPGFMSQNQHHRSNSYIKQSNSQNPEQQRVNITNKINQQNTYLDQNHSQTSYIRHLPQHHISHRERQIRNSPQIYATKHKYHHQSVLDNSRRIKSQLVEGTYQHQNNQNNEQKLPTIPKKNFPPQRENTSFNSTNINKKQYFRYNVISGKQVAFYV